jgi:hypothetical protein
MTFEQFREKLKNKILETIEKQDEHHKSYEGAMRLTCPDIFTEGDENNPHVLDNPFILEIDCYVLGNTRHYEYSSLTLQGCIKQAASELLEE